LSQPLARLQQRIIQELMDIERSVVRSQQAWQAFQQTSSDLYLDSVALNLYSFYNGIERLFESIAALVDGDRPAQANWHQVLLAQMATEIPEVRPAIISSNTYALLDHYCRFRHVVRHIYGFQLDAEQLLPLVEMAPSTFTQINMELRAFSQLLITQNDD
jgi:hypothetical protein